MSNGVITVKHGSRPQHNASMATLAPILASQNVQVTWDTSTLESVHIYGYQPK